MSGFELDDVKAGAAERPRLDGVTLDLSAEGITVLVGASGSGKSSLLRLLNRLDVPVTGEIRWRGEDLSQVDVLMHRREVGMVFQQPTASPGTVLENLRIGAIDLDEDAAIDLLSIVALDESFLDRDAGALSGGELQRVCLARTLATGPEVVLADEPTSSLDPESTEVIEALALRFAAPDSPWRVGWIWVSHDPGQARRLADRLVVMAEGRVVTDGSVEALSESSDPDVRRALGQGR